MVWSALLDGRSVLLRLELLEEVLWKYCAKRNEYGYYGVDLAKLLMLYLYNTVAYSRCCSITHM